MLKEILATLKEQRWDDHRYYHHSRINQTLHFVSACSFLIRSMSRSFSFRGTNKPPAPSIISVLAVCGIWMLSISIRMFSALAAACGEAEAFSAYASL